MLAGEPYDAYDPELVRARERARAVCQRLNALPVHAPASERRALQCELFGVDDLEVEITPPFHCDYGTHIALGRGVYFNVDCVVLDVVRVTIGDRVLFGPAVQLYTATHPLRARERRAGLESGRPIVIGDDAWIGGGAIVLPGVTIGAGAVIGAGSVVTRDVPANALALGNPCRVVRVID